MNTTVSYYLKGGLITMLLNLQIIKATAGKRCFDDVMRKLFVQHLKTPKLGFTREDFFETVASVAPINTRKFIAEHIDGVKTVNWKKEFAHVGIDVKQIKNQKKQYLGVVMQQIDGKPMIQSIAEDSPAYNSLLQAGDEIVAVNGSRFEAITELDPHLTSGKLNILVARRGKMYQADINLETNSRPNYKLEILKKISPTQKRYLKKFLHQT